MKKRALTVTVLIILSLITVTVVGAKALYVTKPVPNEERHSISEIVSPSSKWEKVAVGSGFMEGINFDRSGNIWMVSPPIRQANGSVFKPTCIKYDNFTSLEMGYI